MKKIVITGGDNCYCCECGGRCDRLVMEEDSEEKTLKYIDHREHCLGRYCWSVRSCNDGTELRQWCGKVRAFRNGVELPCAVRNNKWGKDGDYGTRGSTFFATAEELEAYRKGEALPLKSWRSDEAEEDYYKKLEAGERVKRSDYAVATGWSLKN